ncbi:Protein yippee-like [Glycine max]|nr:Protein yippee-like [Glycine max]
MGRVFVLELDGRSYGCKFCNTPLALADHILSRYFVMDDFGGPPHLQGPSPTLRVNVTLGPQVDRMMISGLHTVEDIFCCSCGQPLGWKYVLTHEKNEIYKEGKFVLERWTIVDNEEEELNSDAQAGSLTGSQSGSSDTENA